MTILLATSPATAQEVATVYYGPATNLEDVDVALIAQSQSSLDLVAYILTDSAIIAALQHAADRGVAIRIYLDSDQAVQVERSTPRALLELGRLAAGPNVVAKLTEAGADPMHLKGYSIDGQALRTGSANFTVSGLRYQDNDLVLVQGQSAAAGFTAKFEAMWSRAGNQNFP